MTALAGRAVEPLDGAMIGRWATDCLRLELATYPKPGLVSPIDAGAHGDMDAALMARSACVLMPFFAELAEAGALGAGMDQLRSVGIAAERAMLAETGGVNTHRGAIFGLGLLCAAAGVQAATGSGHKLGAIVTERWGCAILAGPADARSHGAVAARRYRVGGARAEAAAGFPSVYSIGLPALRHGRRLSPRDPEAARVQACMALVATIEDTNLLHRGGAEGLAFARRQAAAFLAAGGIGQVGWRDRASAVHRAFVARRLSPGGSADLLAMTLFVEGLEP